MSTNQFNPYRDRLVKKTYQEGYSPLIGPLASIELVARDDARLHGDEGAFHRVESKREKHVCVELCLSGVTRAYLLFGEL